MSGAKIVLLPDVHIDKDGYHPVYKPVKKFIKDFQPDEVVLMGDFADNSPLSHWNLDNKRRIDSGSHKKEIAIINKELDFLTDHATCITWLEGNHENWTEQYLDKHPEMQGFIEYPVVCQLEERNIEWVKLNELYNVGHLQITHGFSCTEAHAKAHLLRLGCNVVYGHTHRSQTYTLNMAMQRTIKAWGLGCLCDKKPSFMRNKVAAWDHGFAVLYVADDGDFNLYPIDIVNGRFYFNGKSYK